ncbi:MAG: hypothetical protein LCH79_17200 [Proteobacteria bacterium]|nr:hypothetical protein [Pseudomonadota bacterium]
MTMFTTLIRTQAESRNLVHRGNVGFECASCWLHLPTGDGIGTGYGVDRAGRLHCYACCTKLDLEAMRKHEEPFHCYVAQDGRSVSNWPGGRLGEIRNYGESRAGWNGSTVARFRVRDVHGRWWTGWGAGRGMVCTLRPMKGAP